MAASLFYHSKVPLLHQTSDEVAIAELKVWKVPKDEGFPEGIKYSLFLVMKGSGQVILGLDNHKPKGHHIHIGDEERPYNFKSVDKLIDDFWQKTKERGF